MLIVFSLDAVDLHDHIQPQGHLYSMSMTNPVHALLKTTLHQAATFASNDLEWYPYMRDRLPNWRDEAQEKAYWSCLDGTDWEVGVVAAISMKPQDTSRTY